MTDWTGFAGAVAVLLALLLLLARASQGVFEAANASGRGSTGRSTSDDTVEWETATQLAEWEWGVTGDPDGEASSEAGGTTPAAETIEALNEAPRLSTRVLLANVLFSHGLFALLLLAAVWYFAIPIGALGVTTGAVGSGAIAIGVALGVGLYGLNELGSAVGRRIGIEGNETLRQALAPDSHAEWLLLLLVVLPLIAGFEELLFRGVLIGALATGFAVSPWFLAVGSSVAFALGHGAQGRAGVVVTGLLGFGLAIAFLLTGSLVAVITAHYLVNALEFIVHEWLGWDPG